MEFIGILFSFFIAVVITAVFSFVLKRTGPWAGFWIFFLLMFFISFAAGEWAAPRGPSMLGYYWVPGLVAAVVVALVLASATPGESSSHKKQRADIENEVNDAEATVASAVLGIFFWLLIVVLAFAAIAGVLARVQ